MSRVFITTTKSDLVVSIKMIAMLRSMKFAILPCFEDYFWSEFDLSDLCCQRDDAACHTVGQTIDLLKVEVRVTRVISRNGPIGSGYLAHFYGVTLSR